MKAFLVAALLLLAACSDWPGPHAERDLSPGLIESVEQVELGVPPEVDPGRDEDDADTQLGSQLVVRLDDGRTVILVYTGARSFAAGQRVRVHVSDLGAFVM